MQPGNVGIAEAGRQMLSQSMLWGLQAGLHERLSKYATAEVKADAAALAKLQGDIAR